MHTRSHSKPDKNSKPQHDISTTEENKPKRQRLVSKKLPKNITNIGIEEFINRKKVPPLEIFKTWTFSDFELQEPLFITSFLQCYQGNRDTRDFLEQYVPEVTYEEFKLLLNQKKIGMQKLICRKITKKPHSFENPKLLANLKKIKKEDFLTWLKIAFEEYNNLAGIHLGTGIAESSLKRLIKKNGITSDDVPQLGVLRAEIVRQICNQYPDEDFFGSQPFPFSNNSPPGLNEDIRAKLGLQKRNSPPGLNQKIRDELGLSKSELDEYKRGRRDGKIGYLYSGEENLLTKKKENDDGLVKRNPDTKNISDKLNINKKEYSTYGKFFACIPKKISTLYEEGSPGVDSESEIETEIETELQEPYGKKLHT